MTVYLDIIFCENILMNYIILLATLVIIKIKNKRQKIRLIISSIIGSAYAIIVYLNILQIYSNIIAKAVLSVVMVYVAFNPSNIKQLCKQLITFYLVSFVFGGCTFALIYFAKPENVQIRNGVFVGTYPIKVAIIAGVVAFTITEIVFKINKGKFNTSNTYFDVELYYEEKRFKIKALLDSGNMLKDPISGMPVIIVEKEKLYEVIPKEVLNYIDNTMKGDESNEGWNIQKYLARVRMVPFMSIGKENGMLTGIRMDKARIENEDINIERTNIIAGIYDKKIAKDNKYNALIGLNLLEGENINEFVTSVKK